MGHTIDRHISSKLAYGSIVTSMYTYAESEEPLDGEPSLACSMIMNRLNSSRKTHPRGPTPTGIQHKALGILQLNLESWSGIFDLNLIIFL